MGIKTFDKVFGKEFMDKSEFKSVQDISFSLTKNKEVVQVGNTKDMIFSFDHIIAYVSQYFKLHQGDLIYTGTPSGVGPITIGDELKGFIEEETINKSKSL